MPQFTIQVPDGRSVTVQADNQNQALSGVQDWYAQNPKQATPQAQQQATPPTGLTPGSREYADWAAKAAMSGQKLPQVSPPPPTGPNMTSPLDQIQAGYTSAVNAVPIAGPFLKSGIEQAKGAMYGVPQQQIAQEDTARQDANPTASTVGSIAGTVLPFMAGGAIPGVGRLLGMSGNLGSRIVMGGLSGAGINGADTIARGGSVDDAVQSAETGGAIGAAFPLAARGLAGVKNGVVNALRGGASASAGNDASQLLKGTASQMFDSSKAAGVYIAPQSYQTFAQNVVRKIAAGGLDKTLHPDTWAALENMLGRGKQPMSLGELHVVRQIAQDASRGALARDATKAGAIVNEIDNFVRGLKPSDIHGGNPRFVSMSEGDPQFQWSFNRSPETGMAAVKFGDNVYVAKTHADAVQKAVAAEGQGIKASLNANPEQHLGYSIAPAKNVKDAANGLLNGISTWSKASKTATIEEALYRASNAASGLENGIRNEFRSLLRNPSTRNLYSPEEQAMMEQVVRGSVLANLTKLVGKFGFGRGQAANMLGGSVGFGAGSVVGGPIGGVLTALAATGARKGSEALTERAAQRVVSKVSGGAAAAPASIPRAAWNGVKGINASPVNLPIAPAVPAMVGRKQPIQITVPYRR